MRLPEAPATERAGGWISAGMISTVHTPLPLLAAMAPSDWAAALRAFAGVGDDLDDGLLERGRPSWPTPSPRS